MLTISSINADIVNVISDRLSLRDAKSLCLVNKRINKICKKNWIYRFRKKYGRKAIGEIIISKIKISPSLYLDIKNQYYYNIECATKNDDFNTIKIIIGPEITNFNKIEIINFMLKDEVLSYKIGNSLLYNAIFNGELDLVKNILNNKVLSTFKEHKYVDGKWCGKLNIGRAIRIASKNNHPNIFKCLLNDIRLTDEELMRHFSYIETTKKRFNSIMKVFLLHHKFHHYIYSWHINRIIMTAVEHANVDLVRFIIMNTKMSTYNKKMVISVMNKDLNKFITLLGKNNFDPTIFHNISFTLACENGSLGILELLINRLDSNKLDIIYDLITIPCRNGNINILKMLLGRINNNKLTMMWNYISTSCKNGHTCVLKELLKINTNSRNCDDLARISSQDSHIVNILLNDDKINLIKFRESVFEIACLRGHKETFQLLLEYINPKQKQNHAIRWASRYGRFDIVKLLLQDDRVDPAARNNEAIRWACKNENVSTTRILLDSGKIDASVNNNEALRFSENLEIINMLLDDHKVKMRIQVSSNKANFLAWKKGINFNTKKNVKIGGVTWKKIGKNNGWPLCQK